MSKVENFRTMREHHGLQYNEQNEAVGGNMGACNFEYLLQFVKKQLDLDKQLEVYEHLDRCTICRDAVYQLSRDLAEVLFIYCIHDIKHYVFRRQIKRAWSRHMQVISNKPALSQIKQSSHRP